jgi:hypothetical protein
MLAIAGMMPALGVATTSARASRSVMKAVGGGDGGTDSEAREHARDEQPGERSPDQ